VTLFGNKYASLAGLSSSDVAYAQQAATRIKITIGDITACAEIDVHNKELDVIKVKFTDRKDFRSLKSKLTSNPQTLHICFILKHSYFKNLHASLARLGSKMIDRLNPSCLQSKQRKLPQTPYPNAECLWLDKEYQLFALKKLMACDCSVPFLIIGPFGTGKTRVLATAAINFLKSHHQNRVLICTSHLQSADAYIDNYFGPMVEKNEMPKHIKPVRLVCNEYVYRGEYENLVKRSDHNPVEIEQSCLVITTFLTTPQLISLEVKFFTHILIDEGAQTCEPETIAPLGLADDNTKIVIAGDHLQVI